MCTKKSAKKRTEINNRMLTKFVSIGSYSSEVRTFGIILLEDIMHSCQLSLISKGSPEVQYNLVN